MKFGKLTD